MRDMCDQLLCLDACCEKSFCHVQTISDSADTATAMCKPEITGDASDLFTDSLDWSDIKIRKGLEVKIEGEEL